MKTQRYLTGRSLAKRRAGTSTLLLALIVCSGEATIAQEEQLTKPTVSGEALPAGKTSISANGSYVVFASENDPLGTNADGNKEIFWYNAITQRFWQVTKTTAPKSCHSPVVSANGRWLAFVSNADLTGDNADGSQEIFLINTNTGGSGQLVLVPSLRQITSTPIELDMLRSGGNREPAINADGTRIAFSSTMKTKANLDSNREIFLYDRPSGETSQLTESNLGKLKGSSRPRITATGNIVVYRSYSDPVGYNGDKSVELFWHKIEPEAEHIKQITATTSQESLLGGHSVDAGGSLVAFAYRDNLEDDNPDLNQEIFVFHTIKNLSHGVNNHFTQITDTTSIPVSPTGGDTDNPEISGDGDSIVFTSYQDLTGNNTDHSEELFHVAYSMDFVGNLKNAVFCQLTSTAQAVPGAEHAKSPSVSEDGSTVAYFYTEGGNTENDYQVFRLVKGENCENGGNGETVEFQRGDANEDGNVDLSDVVRVLNVLFGKARPLSCEKSADFNDDGNLDISGPVFLLNYLFSTGSELPAPFGFCGLDPTPDELTCESFSACPADPLSFQFEGSVFFVSDAGDVFGTVLGDTWAMTLTYDPDQLVGTPLGDGMVYETAPGETGITFTVCTQGDSFVSDNSFPVRIFVENTDPFLPAMLPGTGDDRFTLSGQLDDVTEFNLVMVESLGANPLSSNDLPTVFGSGMGSDWTVSELDIDRLDQFANISGSVSQITPVDEPVASCPE